MIEILRLSDLVKVTHYPRAVVETIRQSIVALDTAYGTDRTRDGDGGLELIVETTAIITRMIFYRRMCAVMIVIGLGRNYFDLHDLHTAVSIDIKHTLW